MSGASRNEIYGALARLLPAVTLGGDPPRLLVTTGRKFRIYGDVPADQQPAGFQTEPTEAIQQRTGLEPIRQMHAFWTFYFKTQPGDPDDVGAAIANDIVDACEAVLAYNPDEPQDEFNVQTLGGRVHACRIDGEVVKVAGDEDGQGMVLVPILLLVP